MATTVTWKNEYEQTCVLTIQDGSNTTTELTPAAEPFMTSIQESDDIFTPVRTQSGYIRVVVDSVNDIAYLVGSAPMDRAVDLSVAGAVMWRGFLACESFTQSWDAGPLELELPVVSPLEVLKGLYPSSDITSLGYINIAKFLYNMNSALGFKYTLFYFPVISNTPTTLQYLLDMKNYATSIDKNTGHEMASYYDILEDICKLFGWQLVEWEYNLVFMAADVKSLETYNQQQNNYRGYYTSRMLQIANGTSTSVSTRPVWATVTPEIFGADHDMSWVAGKKSVEVTGKLNERSDEIWSMNVVEQCVFKGYAQHGYTLEQYRICKYGTYQGEGESYPNGCIRAYNSVYGTNTPDVGGTNVKFYNHGTGKNAYGGSAACEMFYKTNTSHEVTSGEKQYVQRLIAKSYSTPLITCFEIRTNFWYEPTQNSSNDRLSIEADVKRALNADDAFATVNGTIYLDMRLALVGQYTTYYYDPNTGWNTDASSSFIVAVKDGKIQSYGYNLGSSMLFRGHIPVPTDKSGEIVLYILASTDGTYSQGDSYISYENLSINITSIDTRSRSYLPDVVVGSDNMKKINLNNGFTEAWTQECNLTLSRQDVSDSSGVVLTSTKGYPTSLYDNKWPEDALAERAQNYFIRARLRIRAIVKGESRMLSPLVPYTFESGGKTYVCIEQQKNWRTGEIRANFYEPTYET